MLCGLHGLTLFFLRCVYGSHHVAGWEEWKAAGVDREESAESPTLQSDPQGGWG